VFVERAEDDEDVVAALLQEFERALESGPLQRGIELDPVEAGRARAVG
jgi:hypothetical protein